MSPMVRMREALTNAPTMMPMKGMICAIFRLAEARAEGGNQGVYGGGEHVGSDAIHRSALGDVAHHLVEGDHRRLLLHDCAFSGAFRVDRLREHHRGEKVFGGIDRVVAVVGRRVGTSRVAAPRKVAMSRATTEAVRAIPGAEATPRPRTAAIEPPEATTPLNAPSAAAGARIRDLQVGPHRANLVEVQAETANILQALDVVARLSVRLEDEASTHRGLGHRGRFLHEAKPHRGHRPGDGSTPGDLARHRHNRAEGRHQVGTQALGDDARAPGADLRFFPTLDVLPLGSVAGAHARAGLLVGRLVVPEGFFHAATLHNAAASRGVGAPTALLC